MIEVKNVSKKFRRVKALDNISFNIEEGKITCILGINGVGKSTILKSIAGLIKPDKGEILIDGKDIKEIEPEILYQGVSAVFQKYQCYKMTVAENVQLSDVQKMESVKEVLEKADFPLDNGKFTDRTETMLGKDFGGIDLSGGQWQRLAIARGLYRAHNMIVLDEPTAAIDPLEEANIYYKFAEISKDKTAFIVTHRLGSAKIADRIIVMDAGHIVEMGTHNELMDRNGKYYELYQAQAKWYR